MSAGVWMPLYVADYLADTGHLSTEEHGAYLLLIMHYWQHGSLPDDDAKLARICRLSLKKFKSTRSHLEGLFSPGWKHKRVDMERDKSLKIKETRRAIAVQMHMQKQSKSRAKACANGLPITITEEEKEIGTASPVEYAFVGKTVRLKPTDFATWQAAFRNLDLVAELTARDAWLNSEEASAEDRRKWFLTTSRWLANRNAEAAAKGLTPKGAQKPRPQASDWAKDIDLG